MKRRAFSLMVLTATALAGTVWAEQGQDQEQPPLRLELDLADGSHLIGIPGIRAVPVQTPYARMEIPLQQIMTIKMDENHETGALDLQNGDKLKGVLHLEPIALETVFGKVSVGIEHITKLGVTSAGGPLPPGEGPLSFGGVNWLPWRTLFEVQGDKLVALPTVRPGFNYGHGGNGRGATLVTNIGNADWQDYRVEFEFGMTGVDPAFNPHGLAADYRAGSILFHVADGNESWNVRGGSWYGFNLGGDGSWSLSCTYNGYCQTPCGYGNPTSDGSRILAESKGLKSDPATGNKIRIEICGTRIRIWVDGTQVVDVRDDKMTECLGGQTLDHGGIGFTWGFESMGWIRNFSAKRL